MEENPNATSGVEIVKAIHRLTVSVLSHASFPQNVGRVWQSSVGAWQKVSKQKGYCAHGKQKSTAMTSEQQEADHVVAQARGSKGKPTKRQEGKVVMFWTEPIENNQSEDVSRCGGQYEKRAKVLRASWAVLS